MAYMNTGSFGLAAPTVYINGCRDNKYKNGNRTISLKKQTIRNFQNNGME